MYGYYHSIETFGTVDGRGIRYVLFLAGCALGCVFCHNPDTWERGDQKITVAEVLSHYSKYRHFYRASGGGITVSGGEPLLQADFIAALFRACRRRHIHTTVDTSGFCPPENVLKVLPYTDEALFSIKAVAADKHRQLTKADNEGILENLRLISAAVSTTVRYVVIPGVNDDDNDIMALAELVKSLPRSVPVELLPYHTMGCEKWAKMGWQYKLAGVREANTDDINRVGSLLTQYKVKVLNL